MRKVQPTNSELDILALLWQRGPSTVRDVHEALSPVRGTGYTTILKLMQIMHEKGLLSRKEDSRAHLYEAAYSQSAAQGNILDDMTRRLFGGSSGALVLRALETERASKEELDAIRELLDRMDKE